MIQEISDLPDEQADLLEEIVADFDRRLRDDTQAANTTIDEYIVRVDESMRPILIKSLLRVERQVLGERGEDIQLDAIVQRFPDLENLVREVFDETINFNRSDRASHSKTQDEIPDKIGRYRVIKVLGVGGFAIVYLAFDPKLDRQVALKVPRKDKFSSRQSADAFVQEAKTAAKLRHPNLVAILDADVEPDGTVLVSMQFIEGQTLAAERRRSNLSPEDVVELLTPIAEAVQYIHNEGLIHRDLKPGNVLLDTDGRPHVVDFGLAQPFVDGEAAISDGGVAGTLDYMPPEQARGEPADRRSDVYALGAILYCLLTNAKPFKGEPTEILSAVRAGQTPTPPIDIQPKIPLDLNAICLKAMSVNPANRYPTAHAFADDLRRFADGSPVDARPDISFSERAQKWVRRNPALSLAAGFAFVALLIASGLLIRNKIMASDVAEAREENVGLVQENKQLKDPRIRVSLETMPLGAEVTFVLCDETTGIPDNNRTFSPAKRTPIVDFELPPGHYRVFVHKPGFGSHEVERTVPEELPGNPNPAFPHLHWFELEFGSVRLPRVTILPDKQVEEGMVLIRGGDISVGAVDRDDIPLHTQRVRTFKMDAFEVSSAEWNKVMTGLPSAFTAHFGKGYSAETPICFITKDEALKFAELVGKSLPSEIEFLYAATNGGQSKYPWGETHGPDISLTTIGNPNFDRTYAWDSPVFNLFSGQMEITNTTGFPYDMLYAERFDNPRERTVPAMFRRLWKDSYVLLGGQAIVSDARGSHSSDSQTAWENGPLRMRVSRPDTERNRAIGFRCVKRVMGNY